MHSEYALLSMNSVTTVKWNTVRWVSWVLVAVICQANGYSAELGEIDLTIVDAETKKPIAARLRIQDSRGRPPRIKGVPRLGNDFTFRDTLTFEMKKGRYFFTIEHGPHFKKRAGHLDVDRDGFDQKTLELPRFVDLRKKGYFSGDLLCTRDPNHIDLLMQAEDLDLTARPNWTAGKAFNEFTKNRDRSIHDETRVRDFSASVLECAGGRINLLNHGSAISPTKVPTDSLGFAQYSRDSNGHLAVLDPWMWDMPMLVANGLVDSLSILGDTQRLDSDAKQKAGIKSKTKRFAGSTPHATGRYAQHIYFQLLNCGLRIAPSAFSNSGDVRNPPGYNRVYVQCDKLSSQTWYENLELGKSIVSNGPVLTAKVNGQHPGYVFHSDQSPLKLEVTCELSTRQKIEYLDVIKDGVVLDSVRLDKWAAAGGHLPIVQFDESGWLMIRAYAVTEENFRCAVTAPFYVEIGETPRISKSSADFFVSWVLERGRQIRDNKELSKADRRRRLAEQKHAYEFWAQLSKRANAK